jgi:anti-sigma B factor antagonist
VHLDIQEEDIDATTHLIKLRGEIDLYTAPAFRERVVQLIASGKKHIVLDPSKVTFVDASNPPGVLMEDAKRLQSAGGSISLVWIDQNVRRVYEITGLDRAFPVHSSRDAALAALGYSPDRPRPAADAEAPVARREDLGVARAWRDAERALRRLREAEKAAEGVPFRAYGSPEEAQAEAERSPPEIGQLFRAKAEFERAMTAVGEAEQTARERRDRGSR